MINVPQVCKLWRDVCQDIDGVHLDFSWQSGRRVPVEVLAGWRLQLWGVEAVMEAVEATMVVVAAVVVKQRQVQEQQGGQDGPVACVNWVYAGSRGCAHDGVG